jgi:hypothetical protein
MTDEVVRSGTGETYDGDRAMLSSLQRLTFVGELLRGRVPKLPHYTAETLPAADASQRYAVAILTTSGSPDDAVICLQTVASPETYDWISFGILEALTLVDVHMTGGLELDGDLNHDGTNVGFFGVTPVDRPGANEDIKDALASLGLLTNGGASPLNLDAGAIVAGAASFTTMESSGNAQAGGILYANGGFRHIASTLLFWDGTGHASKPTVTGSRGGNAALASLLTALATYGLITDSSS